MEDKVRGLIGLGKTPKEVANELGISFQKVNSIMKKEEEQSPEMFVKETNVIKDANMGGSVIMTAAEYAEYSKANGRYQGRKDGQKTQLNTGELRIALKQVSMGRASGSDMKQHLLDKHGITEHDIINTAIRLTQEEETPLHKILKPLGIRG